MKSNIKNSVEVIIEDLSSHPKCEHGPTLLFSLRKNGSKYFACSCARDLKFCSFKVDFRDFEAGRWKNAIPKKRDPGFDQESLTINEVGIRDILGGSNNFGSSLF